MMSPPCFALVCMTWSLLNSSAAFAFLLPASVPGGGNVVAAHHRASSAVVAGCGSILNQRSGDMKLTLNVSTEEDDDGGESFGAKAMRERTNAQLQEMVSSHNILAFIKV